MEACQLGPSVSLSNDANKTIRVGEYLQLCIPKNPIEDRASSEQCEQEVIFGFARRVKNGLKYVLDIYRHVILDEEEGFQIRDGLPKESLIPIPTFSESSEEPTPEQFGAPLKLNGWKCERKSWLNVVPVQIEIPDSSSFRKFNPPITMSGDEHRQLDAYRRSISAFHVLGLDDAEALAAEEARRARTYVVVNGSDSSNSRADSGSLKEQLAMIAMCSDPVVGQIFAKELARVLKQEEEERALIRDEKLQAWFHGLPQRRRVPRLRP